LTRSFDDDIVVIQLRSGPEIVRTEAMEMNTPKWDIQREGRSWGAEAMSRYELTPEKIELIDGRLFWSDEERLTMLAQLLENVGADTTVRLGDPEVRRAAVAGLDDRGGQV
jgi:hypothetical protein